MSADTALLLENTLLLTKSSQAPVSSEWSKKGRVRRCQSGFDKLLEGFRANLLRREVVFEVSKQHDSKAVKGSTLSAMYRSINYGFYWVCCMRHSPE